VTIETLIEQVREGLAQLERENAILRRENDRLARENGELCDTVHSLREQINDEGKAA
jgi:predicted RNase H-like nuclease (RuvC/YqgF family)